MADREWRTIGVRSCVIDRRLGRRHHVGDDLRAGPEVLFAAEGEGGAVFVRPSDGLGGQNIAAATGLGGDGPPEMAVEGGLEHRGSLLVPRRLPVRCGGRDRGPESEDRRVHGCHKGHRLVGLGQSANRLHDHRAGLVERPPPPTLVFGHDQPQKAGVGHRVEIGSFKVAALEPFGALVGPRRRQPVDCGQNVMVVAASLAVRVCGVGGKVCHPGPRYRSGPCG